MTNEIKAFILQRQIITLQTIHTKLFVWMLNFILFICLEITSDINIRNEQKQNHVMVPLR